MSTAWPLPHLLSAASLTVAQRRTVVVGVALAVAAAHRVGRVVGPLHLTHVEVDETGRPRIRAVVAPPGWRIDDDLTALHRLARGVGCAVSRASDVTTMVTEAIGQGVEPLPPNRPDIRPFSQSRGRWPVRRRSWGPRS